MTGVAPGRQSESSQSARMALAGASFWETWERVNDSGSWIACSQKGVHGVMGDEMRLSVSQSTLTSSHAAVPYNRRRCTPRLAIGNSQEHRKMLSTCNIHVCICMCTYIYIYIYTYTYTYTYTHIYHIYQCPVAAQPRPVVYTYFIRGITC